MTSLIVNGQTQQVDEQLHDRLVDALRVGVRLTGTKESCSSGACGACTVLADGVAVLSCLFPTKAAAGRTIETIEGLGPALHPIQRALMAHDGLQCGFCTPGVVMQGVAFYRRWRAARGNAAPTREEVNDAMAGHLCRCGAYIGIVAAITRACAGDFDGDTDPPSPRHDARYKVTGAAKYTVDVYPDGVLEGAILRSVHAHALVHSIDSQRALAAPGVRAVISMLGDGTGPWEIRYVGQEIAAVAAVSAKAALDALLLIDVASELLPAAIGTDGARADGAPSVYRLGGPRSPASRNCLWCQVRITTTSTGRSSSSRTIRSAPRRRWKPRASHATGRCSNAPGARRGNAIRRWNRTRRWPSGRAAIDSQSTCPPKPVPTWPPISRSGTASRQAR